MYNKQYSEKTINSRVGKGFDNGMIIIIIKQMRTYIKTDKYTNSKFKKIITIMFKKNSDETHIYIYMK